MRTETESGYRAGIERVVRYVLENLDGDLSPATLADKACFSTFHFHRIFRGMMCESAGEMVRRVRLERAAWQLLNGARVTETSVDAGYESHEGFTRAFQAAFSVPPSEIKKLGYNRCSLPCPNGAHFDPLGTAPTLRFRIGESQMNVEIRNREPFRVVAMTHTGPYFMIGSVFGRIAGWAQQHGVPFTSSIAIYYDDPDMTPANELRSEACLVVDSSFTTDDPEVHVVDVSGGKYAVATHVGHYESLGVTWQKFVGEWFPQSGYAMGKEPSFEEYLDDCSVTPPEKLRTELWVSVE